MNKEQLKFTNLEEVLDKYGEQFISIYRQNLLNKRVDSSGLLGSSLKYQVSDETGQYEVILNIQDYWKYVEEGRRAGKYPPINDIKKWITTKRILPRMYNGKLPSINQLAYLISRKIHLRGTTGKHPMQDSLDELESLDLLDEAISKDLNSQVDTVLKVINNGTK